MLDQGKVLEALLRFNRRFTIGKHALEVETRVASQQRDKPAELVETIPSPHLTNCEI